MTAQQDSAKYYLDETSSQQTCDQTTSSQEVALEGDLTDSQNAQVDSVLNGYTQGIDEEDSTTYNASYLNNMTDNQSMGNQTANSVQPSPAKLRSFGNMQATAESFPAPEQTLPQGGPRHPALQNADISPSMIGGAQSSPVNTPTITQDGTASLPLTANPTKVNERTTVQGGSASLPPTPIPALVDERNTMQGIMTSLPLTANLVSAPPPDSGTFTSFPVIYHVNYPTFIQNNYAGNPFAWSVAPHSQWANSSLAAGSALQQMHTNLDVYNHLPQFQTGGTSSTWSGGPPPPSDFMQNPAGAMISESQQNLAAIWNGSSAVPGAALDNASAPAQRDGNDRVIDVTTPEELRCPVTRAAQNRARVRGGINKADRRILRSHRQN